MGMNREWKEYQISDIADVIGGGTPKTSITEYWNGNIPWLAPKDLTGYTSIYISHGSRFITDLGLKKSSAKLLPKGTVLLTSRAPIGYVTIAKNEICTNQGFKSLIPKKELCISKFLYYWIKDNIDTLKQLGTGTTFAEISGTTLKSVKIKLPPLQTQKKIAHILSTLDDKIELNRKMNKTLEAMAQALFKSWFVDFDPVHAKAKAKSEQELEIIASQLGISKEILDLFPSEFEESELGMIPKGWEVKTLKSVSKVIMGQSPKGESYNIEGQGLPLLNGAADFKGEGFSPKKFTTDSKRQCKKGDLVFCIRATIGLLTYADQEYSLGRGVSAIAANEMYREIIYLTLYKQIERMKSNATGSVILGLKKDDIENIQIVVSSKVLLDAFHNINKNLFGKIEVNKIEIATLQKTRDTLLPKLLSGELNVSNLDISV